MSQLKKHFAWELSNEGTSLKYVDNTKAAKFVFSGMLKVPSTTPISPTTEEYVHQQQLIQKSHRNITKTFNIQQCKNNIINFK